MQDLQIFSFDGIDIRAVSDGKRELFPLAQVALCVGYHYDTSALAAKVQASERMMVDGKTYITEAGIYQITMVLETESALRFREWVTKTVLPSIRRTGGYDVATVEGENDDPMIALLKTHLQTRRKMLVLEQQMAEGKARQDVTERRLNALDDTVHGGVKFVALVGYFSDRKWPATQRQLGTVGNRLSRWCRANGHPIGETKSEIFGHLNLYLRVACDEYFTTVESYPDCVRRSS